MTPFDRCQNLIEVTSDNNTRKYRLQYLLQNKLVETMPHTLCFFTIARV